MLKTNGHMNERERQNGGSLAIEFRGERRQQEKKKDVVEMVGMSLKLSFLM